MTGVLNRRGKVAAPIGRRHVDGPAFLRARRAVLAVPKKSTVEPRVLAREVDELLRLEGYLVTEGNVPPPGWTIEEDRREEFIALGEITANRKAF